MKKYIYEFYLAPFVRFFRKLGWRGLLFAVGFAVVFQFMPVLAIPLVIVLLIWVFV